MQRRWKWKNGKADIMLFGICMLLTCLLTGIVLAGCSKSKQDGGDKVKDLEFHVIERADIPEELAKLIAEKEKQPFKMTYNDETSLYIVVGYGEQKTGGYSIQVKECYLGENAIYVDTELIGPSADEANSMEKSMPYIVLKMEFMEEPVVFQ